jgi:hypothetical protein
MNESVVVYFEALLHHLLRVTKNSKNCPEPTYELGTPPANRNTTMLSVLPTPMRRFLFWTDKVQE